MSASVAELASFLEQLQARVSALEGKPGVVASPARAASSGAVAAAPAASSGGDDEPTAATREWDALIAKYGEPLAACGVEIGGDVAELVS